MISRVIEAKPDELRVFLEEAAGISKYKERRKETESRLADTRENLARITDIRLELGAQLEKLDAQARVATRYREYHSDLQLKQHLLWYLRRRDAGTERDRHTAELDKTTNTLEAENAQLRSIEARLEAARAAHYQAGDALNTAQGALYAANAAVASHESQLRYAEETRSRLEGQHTERRAQLASWREQRAQLTQSLHHWAARATQAKTRSAECRAALERENTLLPRAEETFAAAQEAAAEARSRVQQAESAQQLEQANLAHLERNAQALAQRRERLENELQTLAAPDAATADALAAGIGELERALQAARAEVETLQGECARLEEERAAAADALGAAERDLAAAQAQLATLRQIQADTENNEPLRGWLEKHALGSLPRLWQKLRIDAGWETAVEAVLRERLHALELGSAGVSGLLAEVPPAKASVFERGASAQSESHPGYQPLASRIHASDPEVAGALADWLAGVFAIDGHPSPELRRALAAGMVLVNREGQQFTRHTVSFHGPDAADAGLLARQAEIEALEGRYGSLRSAKEDAHARLGQSEERAAAAAQALEGARALVGHKEKARHDAQIEELKHTQAEERYREREAQVRAELAEVAEQASRTAQELATCQAAAARIAAERASLEASVESAREALAAAEGEVLERRKAAQQAEREAQDAVFGERECASKINEIDHSVRVIDQQIELAEIEIAKLTGELAADPIPGVRHELETAVEARIVCEKTLAGARDAVEAAAASLRELEEGRLQIEGRAAPLRERLNELRLKQQAAQLNYEQFATQLSEAASPCSRATPSRRRGLPACRARSRASARRSASSAR